MVSNTDIYGYPASHYSMPIEAVEKIELIRGTGALQYGQQFGGMLNYILKEPDSTRRFSFENLSTVGSYGLLSSFNAVGGKVGKLTCYAYYWVNESKLFDAKSGKLHSEISEAEAREIAQIYIKENLQIREVNYLTDAGAHHEYRGTSLPAWAIHFDTSENLVAYVDAKSGQFTKVRHRAWRWFDFLWMFHTMDYAGRDNFNNLLLRIFSLAGLAAVGSGFTLFIMTLKKKRHSKK